VPDALSRRLILAAALVASVALTTLVVAPGASAGAKPCGEKVVDDWWNNGRVDQIFPIHCYLEAIRSLPVDVKDYSNAEDDIRRALAYARQHKPDPGPSGGNSQPTSVSTSTDTTPTPGGGSNGNGSGSGDGSGNQTVAVSDVDTSGPSSLPIPLLILGGLALLLLAAGGAGYLSRRAQARREGGPPGPA